MPQRRGRRRFLAEYVRDCLEREELAGCGRVVVRALLTPGNEMQVRTRTDVEKDSGLRECDVRCYLRFLSDDGIVRQVNAGRWQLAHAFVARVVGYVLSSWRDSAWKQIRWWVPRAALATCIAAVIWFAFRPAWYERINPVGTRAAFQQGFQTRRRASYIHGEYVCAPSNQVGDGLVRLFHQNRVVSPFSRTSSESKNGKVQRRHEQVPGNPR